MIPVCVVVPWRDKGDPDRLANLEMVIRELAACRIGPVRMVTDGKGDGPFNRSAAYNQGVAQLQARVYIFHEADMLIPVEQLRQAAEQARTHPGLVVPFTSYHYLSADTTTKVRAGHTNPYTAIPQRRMTNSTSTGAVNVVSAATLDLVGCWDETFEGWGYDDRAMTRAFEVAAGRPTRFTPGVGIHLWHPPGWQAGGKFAGGSKHVAADEQYATTRNRLRYRAYQQATTVEQVRALTAGGGV